MAKSSNEKHLIKKPYYTGGLEAMRAFIKTHLRYPEKASAAKIEGSVYLQYTINHKGKVIAAKVISSLGYGCDEEAIRLVKLLEFNTSRIRKVRALFHKHLRIHFKLPEVKTSPANVVQYHYTPAKNAVKKPDSGGYTIQIKL